MHKEWLQQQINSCFLGANISAHVVVREAAAVACLNMCSIDALLAKQEHFWPNFVVTFNGNFRSFPAAAK